MATLAASLPRPREDRGHRAGAVLLVGLLGMSAAALYAWMRLPLGGVYHSFYARTCENLAMQPNDLHCRITETSTTAAALGAAILVGLGLMLPGAILAADGRRLSAIVPVAVAGAGAAMAVTLSAGGQVSAPFGLFDTLFSGDVQSFWARHPELAVIVDVLLVSVPALAIELVLRPSRRPRPRPLPRHATWVATFAMGGAIVTTRLALPRVSSDYFAMPLTDVWTTTVIALFGVMLGTERRWWPWSLVPVAVLLSLGPAMAVLSVPSQMITFTWFGGVIPLVLVGVLASLWRPLAERLAGPVENIVPGIRVSDPSRPPAHVRPVVVMNAFAVALLAVSAIAKAADPLPTQLATPLPTYLGARELAQDVRAKMNLELAVDAAITYRAEHGSFTGFDADTGEATLPELDWSDRPTDSDLTVAVTAASDHVAQLIVRSGSGEVFCIQTDVAASRLTFGSAHRSVAEARANCTGEPWRANATPNVDVESLCAGIDQSAMPICRSVQRLLRRTIASPTAIS